MQTIGEKLAEARQRQGILIREAAENTKVRGDFLEAMENNQFDRIALADVYKRGFLKIYAKYLHLDSERLVSEYNSLNQSRLSGGHRRLQRDVLGRGDGDKPSLTGAVDDSPDTDFASSVVESGGRPALPKAITTLLWVAGIVVAVAAVVQLARCAGGSSSENPESPATAVSAENRTYQLKIYAQQATEVTITQTADRKVIFRDQVVYGRPRELVAKGPIEVASPKLSEIIVQIGGRNYTTSNKDAEAFKIDNAPEITGRAPQ